MSVPSHGENKKDVEKDIRAWHFFQMEYVPIWLRDEREEGIKIGKGKGKKEGMDEKAKETVKRILDDGLPIVCFIIEII